MPRAVIPPAERVVELFLSLPPTEARTILASLVLLERTLTRTGVWPTGDARPAKPRAARVAPVAPATVAAGDAQPASPSPPAGPGSAAGAPAKPGARSHKKRVPGLPPVTGDGSGEGGPGGPPEATIIPRACQICGSVYGTLTTRALNGLPKGVVACDDCRAAVQRREVGVARREDGTLQITDGRTRSADDPGLAPDAYQDVVLPGTADAPTKVAD